MKAPFPWFGGKSRAAHLVWDRFGNVPNYVEPFAGSLAVLLARPHEPAIETVNDLDCFIANFWRAAKSDPEAVCSILIRVPFGVPASCSSLSALFPRLCSSVPVIYRARARERN